MKNLEHENLEHENLEHENLRNLLQQTLKLSKVYVRKNCHWSIFSYISNICKCDSNLWKFSTVIFNIKFKWRLWTYSYLEPTVIQMKFSYWAIGKKRQWTCKFFQKSTFKNHDFFLFLLLLVFHRVEVSLNLKSLWSYRFWGPSFVE